MFYNVVGANAMDTLAWYQVAIMVAGWLFGWYLALRPQEYYEMALPYLRPLVPPPFVIRLAGIFFILINSLLIAYAIAARLR